MTFRLLVKQAVRDFKSKLQLYLSFAIFLIVCLSIIIGLLGFFNSYSSVFDNVFHNGNSADTHIPSVKFLDKNAGTIDKAWAQKTYPKDHYLYDKDGNFENFVMDVLNGTDKKNGDWGHDFSSEEIKAITYDDNLPAANNEMNLINIIGTSNGYASWGAIWAGYNEAHAHGDIANLPAPTDINDYLKKDALDKTENLYKAIIGSTSNETDRVTYASRLRYYAIIKLNRVTEPSLLSLTENLNEKFFNGCIGDKYIVEKMIPQYNQFKIGYNVGMDWWPGFQYKNTKDHLRISMMPQDDWMDNASGSTTPNQFKTNDIANLWVKERLATSKISNEVLKDRSYAYVTPSFAHEHDIKLGDKIDVSDWLQDGQGFNAPHQKGVNNVTVIGEALSRDSYFTNREQGVIFLPIQYLDRLAPLNTFDGSTAKYESKYYQPGHIFDSFSVYDSEAGEDYQKAADDISEYLFQDFVGANGDQNTDLNGSPYKILGPITWSDLKTQEANVFLFRILCYSISAGVAILDIIVFWFICAESIKLQKKTLWFLKALGEHNWKISLLPTLGIMAPFIMAAILSIFGSLFVSNILIGAIGNSYGFYLPVWSFDVYSLVVLIIIIAISFVIFLVLGYIQLSGNALSLQSDRKVGWIIALYMKTKPMYKKLPTDAQIGISFIVQNIMKNILTLVLLLISFAVVLFSMQFGSSARASAHSYENRNAPYKSLMLNKLNNVDAIQLDQNYIDKDLGLPQEDQWAVPALSQMIAPMFGEGYNTANVSDYKNDENSTAKDVFTDKSDPLVLATAKIDSTDQLKTAMDDGVIDVYNMLIDPNMSPTNLKPEHAFYNKYFSQNYMENYILDQDWPADVIAEKLFTSDTKWVKPFIERFLGLDGKPADDLKILTNLHNHGIINNEEYMFALPLVIRMNGTTSENSAYDVAYKLLSYAANNFTTTINQLRSTYNSAKSSLNVKSIPLNVYFNKVLIPKNLGSAYITDLMYNVDEISGFGLDNRDSATYKKIVSPLGAINKMDVKDLDSDSNIIKYNYLNNNREKVSLNVHHIDAYISGNFATSYHINKGDVIDLKAMRIPLAGLGSVSASTSYPDVFVRVKGVVDESSIYKEIYFNKIDFFNYLHEYIQNDWMDDIQDQRQANDAQSSDTKNTEPKDEKTDTSGYPLGLQAELARLQSYINQINSDDPDARYALNNSVFSKDSIPYGFSHWTMNTKTGVGYTLLDYINLPVFDYSSDTYPVNYASNLYVFSLITQHLMKTVQPIITTLDKFVAILLILTFVVALILINLVLWENKQTILLFKAIGYKKREIDGYLLTGYIIADCLGLAFGILISFYGIRYASAYAFNMLHVSLFFVWSWQFLVTAIAMAVVFIAMIFIAVNWYTARQKPRDAFNTL